VDELSDPVGGPVPPPARSDPAEPTSSDPVRTVGRRPRPVFLLVGVVLAVALAVGLFTGVGTGGTGPGGRPQAGGAVPSFSLPRLGGGTAVGVPADGGGGGRPAVLLFFASWCGPCQTEIPAVAALSHRQEVSHSPLAKVALIGIDGSDPTADALRFVHHSGVTFPVGVDTAYAVTQGLFYFTGLPDAVFVNGDGTIAAVHQGVITTTLLVEWEHRLLTGG